MELKAVNWSEGRPMVLIEPSSDGGIFMAIGNLEVGSVIRLSGVSVDNAEAIEMHDRQALDRIVQSVPDAPGVYRLADCIGILLMQSFKPSRIMNGVFCEYEPYVPKPTETE